MPESLTRRSAIGAVAALLPAAMAHAAIRDKPETELAAIEKRTGGRLGVAALDTATGARIEHRGGERFAMCSTFKFLAVARVLQRVDKGEIGLARFIPYSQADLLDYAPVTRVHVKDGGMALAALCEAAIEVSDNTAANLILAQIGGPAGVTEFARSLGDPLTRLDRTEPTLNTAIPGDPRDTTSPDAMIADMRKVLLGDTLSTANRKKLEGWMLASKTADRRLRAGLPQDWRVASKTGTGGNGTANEIAMILPPGRKPILVASYLMDAKVPAAERDAAHTDVGRVIAKRFG